MQPTNMKFDPSKLKQCQVNSLLAPVTAGLIDFYDQPENRKKFLEWQKRQREEEANQ